MDYSEMIKTYRHKELISQQELAEMLGVSFASVNRWENGRHEPSYQVKRELKKIFERAGIIDPIDEEEAIMSVKECKINNRRYLGNKYKLLTFIYEVIDQNCRDITSVADIFSGTGAFSSLFWDKEVITNDLLYSNYISNVAWFSPQFVDKRKLKLIIFEYNQIECTEENYMTENFTNTYFSFEDCSKIGYIREDIEQRFLNKEINERERAVLITSLLYSMDKIANTCGHYDAYIKGAIFSHHLELLYPDVPNNNRTNNQCYNEDANELVRKINADLVYIDPPYNSRQYCDAYHLLENVARWQKPAVSGVARKMDRHLLKSKYCTNSATEAMEDLIMNISARYIVLSYNNMGPKGNGRSNAKIDDADIIRILSKKGIVKIYSKEHKAFSTGKSEIEDNEKRLFICICSKGDAND